MSDKTKKVTYVTRLVTRPEGGERDIIEQTCEADWTPGGSRHLLRYAEAENEGRVMLQAAPDCARLHRRGAVSALLHFEAGRRVDARYRTAMGPLALEIHTHDYRLEADEGGGRLEIRYSVFVNGQKAADNLLQAAWSENNS